MINLKKALKEKNISTYQVQRDTGVAESAIRRWMKGVNPRADLLFKVADYLKADARWLMGLKADPDSETKLLCNRIETMLLRYNEKIPGSIEKIEKMLTMLLELEIDKQNKKRSTPT